MRRFLVTGHETPTTAEFSLDDLASGAGRLDVLCRCVGDALLTSHGVRADTSIWLVSRDELTIRIDGAEVRSLSPNERSVAGLLRTALGAADRAVGARWVEASPGVEVAKLGFAAALEAASDAGPVVQLHEDGTAFSELELPAEGTFVLSDHLDFTAEETAVLDTRADARVSLGPTALHADQAITVVQNRLDLLGH
ncbi:MAG: tRNA (pseudouridine(54)-N(1))-methyltransferase TrmY [Halobacteriales archaeon]